MSMVASLQQQKPWQRHVQLIGWPNLGERDGSLKSVHDHVILALPARAQLFILTRAQPLHLI